MLHPLRLPNLIHQRLTRLQHSGWCIDPSTEVLATGDVDAGGTGSQLRRGARLDPFRPVAHLGEGVKAGDLEPLHLVAFEQ